MPSRRLSGGRSHAEHVAAKAIGKAVDVLAEADDGLADDRALVLELRVTAGSAARRLGSRASRSRRPDLTCARKIARIPYTS